MSESSQHFEFVNLLIQYAKTIVSSDRSALLIFDKPESQEKPPKTLEGFIPDLYYNDGNMQIIGEAKSFDDVVRNHSLAQYESYYKQAIAFEGVSIIIISCPIYSRNTVKNAFLRTRKKFTKNIPVHFVSEWGDMEIL